MSRASQARMPVLLDDELAMADGLAQRIDPRIKLVGFAAIIVSVVVVHKLFIIGALFAFGLIIALTSRIPIRTLASRVWIAVLVFTGTISAPAIFMTPGRVVYLVPMLHWTITAQGLASASYLMARAETTATFSLLLVLTTPWMQVLKALRTLGAPVVLIVILGMTYRYIFLLLRTAHDMFESRRSRMVGRLAGHERRRVAVNSAGVLLSKTFQLSGEVYLAMQSRGFRGPVYILDEFRTSTIDWIALAVLLTVATLALYIGR
jgi:cobalt/nickel transport system permease protein